MKEMHYRISASRRRAALGAVAALLVLGALLGLGCGGTPTSVDPCEPDRTPRPGPFQEDLDPCGPEGS